MKAIDGTLMTSELPAPPTHKEQTDAALSVPASSDEVEPEHHTLRLLAQAVLHLSQEPHRVREGTGRNDLVGALGVVPDQLFALALTHKEQTDEC